ncbi:MAG TPA: ABC transporter permease [Chitinophagaceae bacterium]|nr:ABC transporter permease [Chitinophagaceae bacterium]
MGTFILRKGWHALSVLLGVIAIVFFMFFVVLPADPARLTMGQRGDARSLEAIRKEFYLDRPVWQQFILYLNDLSPLSVYESNDELQEKYHALPLFHLNNNNVLVWKAPYLRRSFQTKKEVLDMLTDSFPGTFILATLAMAIASVLGILLGILAAVRQHTWLDRSALFISISGISAPSFFAGILMAWIFGFLLKPYTGLSIISPMWDFEPYETPRFLWKSLILPVCTLAIRPMAIIVQITRSALLDVLSQDYIRTAKAKGLSRARIIWKHALRNALNPVITSISGWFAELLAGSFFIEYIFGWKGLGKITVDALNKFDFPVVMGSVLFTSLIFIIMNILVDVLCRAVDPRIQER